MLTFCSYRLPDCPLVEVKAPHGRLVDADALLKKASVVYSYDGNGLEYEYLGISDIALEDAPTIIEAEGKDDGK